MNLTKMLTFASLLLFFIALNITSCVTQPEDEQKTDGRVMPLPGGGYNLLLKPGKTLGDLKQEILGRFGIEVEDKNVKKCDCDINLFNINIPDLIFDGHGEPQVRQTKGHGEEDEILDISDIAFAVSENFYLDSDTTAKVGQSVDVTSIIDEMKQYKTFNGTDSIIVAILDGGVDRELIENQAAPWWGVRSTACLPAFPAGKSFKGLNFVSDQDKTTSAIVPLGRDDLYDTQDSRHGTLVTHLLTKQFYKNASNNNLGLLVMRILNNKNKGDSFGLMCAMMTGSKLGAKVFNMSLGYYGAEDKVFRKLIDTLTNVEHNRPIFIVAAGNATINEDDTERDLNNMPESRRFYPAYFSKDLDNVVSVTSVFKEKTDPSESVDRIDVCANQNYGNRIVDVGAMSNMNGCLFHAIASNNDGLTNRGTSFATPIVAGWISRKPLDMLEAGNSRSFWGQDSQLMSDSTLLEKIINGIYITP